METDEIFSSFRDVIQEIVSLLDATSSQFKAVLADKNLSASYFVVRPGPGGGGRRRPPPPGFLSATKEMRELVMSLSFLLSKMLSLSNGENNNNNNNCEYLCGSGLKVGETDGVKIPTVKSENHFELVKLEKYMSVLFDETYDDGDILSSVNDVNVNNGNNDNALNVVNKVEVAPPSEARQDERVNASLDFLPESSPLRRNISSYSDSSNPPIDLESACSKRTT